MNLVIKKINQFNKIFNKEEKMVIVLGSVVTLLTIILGFAGLIFLTGKYIEITAPYVENAVNALIGVFFEGWTLR